MEYLHRKSDYVQEQKCVSVIFCGVCLSFRCSLSASMFPRDTTYLCMVIMVVNRTLRTSTNTTIRSFYWISLFWPYFPCRMAVIKKRAYCDCHNSPSASSKSNKDVRGSLLRDVRLEWKMGKMRHWVDGGDPISGSISTNWPHLEFLYLKSQL